MCPRRSNRSAAASCVLRTRIPWPATVKYIKGPGFEIAVSFGNTQKVGRWTFHTASSKFRTPSMAPWIAGRGDRKRGYPWAPVEESWPWHNSCQFGWRKLKQGQQRRKVRWGGLGSQKAWVVWTWGIQEGVPLISSVRQIPARMELH